MATVTVSAAFNMETGFDYLLDLDTALTLETATRWEIAVPNGTTLVLNFSGDTLTRIRVLDGEDTQVFNLPSLTLSKATLESDYIDVDNLLDVTGLVSWALAKADTVNGSGFDDRLYGFKGADTLIGNAGDDYLYGREGNDTMDGGIGIDQMWGGTGNDTYIADDPEDAANENEAEGTDTVQSSVTYTLPIYVENLVLTGTGAKDGFGNEANNTLTGNDAKNTLNGDIGDDMLIGKGGNDTYVVDSDGDSVVEAAGKGTDLVQAWVNHTLAANVEKLELMGEATTGTGNGLNNVMAANPANGSTLTGLDGNDTLTGGTGNDNLKGGAGNDRLEGGDGDDKLHGDAGTDIMIGGNGNDEYWADSGADTVTEGAEGGDDTLYAGFTVSLASYANVENLILTGSGNINGTGSGGDNDLAGNAGNNVLTGGGGSDYLQGKGGNDTLKGGAGDDNMNGGGGSDILNGGAGFDTMAGGTGSDTFVFDTDLELDPNNSVIDFVSGTDRLQLDKTVFTALSVGTLAAGRFVSGASPVALDANDRILYDTGTGNLYYDADGNGSGEAVQFANISGGPDLAASDIIIVA